jgi:AraC-like DNA-binding protein
LYKRRLVFFKGHATLNYRNGCTFKANACRMNQFCLQQSTSKELQPFPHIAELALKRNTVIQLDSLQTTVTDSLRIYYVIDGKFEWIIDERQHILYPGDVAIILPGQKFGGGHGFLDIGTLSWIYLTIEKLEPYGKLVPGKWSSLSENERLAIGKILVMNNRSLHLKLKETGVILENIRAELCNRQIGFNTRINQLIDELFIVITRRLMQQQDSGRDFPKTFLQLEQTLRQRLYYQWTVDEMAALVGLGTTTFNEKVKNFTGFSPLNYLINIRISEAIKLLKREGISVTDIALDTGFYSSQHFSTTFKKLTGFTPSEFRKNNLSKK